LSLSLITLAGAWLCIWYTGIDQAAAFYLLPFRVFQFTAGALLVPLTAALAPGSPLARKITPPAFWLGLLLIAASVYLLGDSSNFPGWQVLLPTGGAGLVLLAGVSPAQRHSLPAWILQNRASIWTGRASCSMYLVHWPIVSLYRYHFGIELSAADQLTLLLAIVLATWAMHYGIVAALLSPAARCNTAALATTGRPVCPGHTGNRSATRTAPDPCLGQRRLGLALSSNFTVSTRDKRGSPKAAGQLRTGL